MTGHRIVNQRTEPLLMLESERAAFGQHLAQLRRQLLVGRSDRTRLTPMQRGLGIVAYPLE